MNRIVHVLIGDFPTAGDVAIKTAALFLTAAILFRFNERRTLAEFAPFDWIAAVAAGAIVGRAATATDTSWLQATTALLCLLAVHAVLARLRLIPAFCRFIDDMDQRFQIDALGMKAEAIAKAWRSDESRAYRKALTSRAVQLLDTAVGAKHFTAAEQLVRVAQYGARASGDHRLARQLEERSRQIKAALRGGP